MTGQTKRAEVFLGDVGEEAVAGLVGPPELEEGGAGRHWNCACREMKILTLEVAMSDMIQYQECKQEKLSYSVNVQPNRPATSRIDSMEVAQFDTLTQWQVLKILIKQWHNMAPLVVRSP